MTDLRNIIPPEKFGGNYILENQETIAIDGWEVTFYGQLVEINCDFRSLANWLENHPVHWGWQSDSRFFERNKEAILKAAKEYGCF